MEGFVLDPQEPAVVSPRSPDRAELRDRVVHEASERARAHALRLVVEPSRRASDLVMLWFQGDRTDVLRAVGGWEPDEGVTLQIAHAGPCAGRYELVLFAAVERTSARRAA